MNDATTNDGPRPPVIFYTNAPKDYDYWYVTELDPDVGNFDSGIDKDKPVRKLDMNRATERQIESQRARYSSGLYPSITEKVMKDWLEFNFFVPKAADHA